MTDGERVKMLRKSLGLTLEKMGETLGVRKTTISRIENNLNALTDQMAKAICRTYGVSEHWLRTGEGEMYIPLTRDEQIAEFVGDMLKDEDDTFKKRLVSVLAPLNENEWEMLEKVAEMLVEKSREVAKEKQSDSGNEAAQD